MATRLEKETILREKAQLEARLDKLFKAQEAQTAGKKERRQMAKGGVFDRLRSNTQAIFGGNPNPNYDALSWPPGSGVMAYNPQQPFYAQIPQTIPGVSVSPGQSQGPYPNSFGNSPYGPGAGINAMTGATQHDYEGANPTSLKSGSTAGVPGAPAAPSTRVAGSDPALTSLSGQPAGQLGGYATPNPGIQQTQPLPGINYQSALGRQGQGGGRNLFPQGGRGLMQGIGTGLSFAGSLYDTFRGLQKPTQFDEQDYFNPQYNRAQSEYNRGIGLMANRRYDPSAELENVERQGAVYRQGLRNLPTSGGALQNRLASQSTREQRQRGQIFSNKQNMDLGFRGQEAQYRAGAARGLAALGSERAQTRFRVADYNERNAAARRNMLSGGLGGLGLGAQNQQLMANQRMRDSQLMGILPSYGGGLYNLGANGVQFGGQGMTREEIEDYVKGLIE